MSIYNDHVIINTAEFKTLVSDSQVFVGNHDIDRVCYYNGPGA